MSQELKSAEDELHSSFDHKPTRRGRPVIFDPKKMREARHFVEELKYRNTNRDIYGEE